MGNKKRKVQENDNMIKPYNMLTRQSKTQDQKATKNEKTKTEAACS